MWLRRKPPRKGSKPWHHDIHAQARIYPDFRPKGPPGGRPGARQRCCQALSLLKFIPNRAAHPVSKVLASAMANGEENFGVSRDDMYVYRIFADEAPTRKWRRFGATWAVQTLAAAEFAHYGHPAGAGRLVLVSTTNPLRQKGLCSQGDTMGRKVNPIGYRLKINKTWEGRWYAEGEEYVNQPAPGFCLARTGSQRSRPSGRISN